MSSTSMGREMGFLVEDVVEERLRDRGLDLERTGKGAIVDFILPTGRPIELKSCREWIEAPGSNGYRRSGRFRLHRRQHRALIGEDGIYLFVLYRPIQTAAESGSLEIETDVELLEKAWVNPETLEFRQTISPSEVLSPPDPGHFGSQLPALEEAEDLLCG